MGDRDPLFPNAAIVARREYRDRVRGPLFLASTVVLMGLAALVAVAPIAIRYFDRQTVTRIVVVSSDAGLADRATTVADQLLNIPPDGVDRRHLAQAVQHRAERGRSGGRRGAGGR